MLGKKGEREKKKSDKQFKSVGKDTWTYNTAEEESLHWF